MTSTNLTAEETELYDRQIRAWGFEAQKRMRESKILIIGLDDAGSELLKNLVLAGVGNITIVENRNITLSLIATHFYLQSIHLNMKWCTVAINFFAEMNPNIRISDMNKNEHEMSASEYQMYDVIIVNGQSNALQMKINDICRGNANKNIAFFSCRSIGEYGYIFADLGTDKYEYRKNKNEKECVSEQWFSLRSGLNISQTSLNAQLNRRKINYRYFFNALRMCEKLENEILNDLKIFVYNNKTRMKIRNIFKSILESMMSETKSCDYIKIFEQCKISVMDKNVNTGEECSKSVDDKVLHSLLKQWNMSVCPSNAMMGGYLANFVMFSLQKIQKPLHNLLLFNMWNCEAIEILMKDDESLQSSSVNREQKLTDISLIDSSEDDDDNKVDADIDLIDEEDILMVD